MALLDAVVTRDLDRLNRAMLEDNSGSNPLERLKNSARRFFFCVEPDSVRFLAFLTSEAIFSEELRDRFATWDRVMADPIIACIEASQDEGLLRRDDTALALFSLLADMIDGPSRRMQFNLPDLFNGMTPDQFSSIAGPSS